MNVQLVTKVAGNQEYIELYGNESLSLDVSFAEIQDITKKNSAYTKEFNVPGTNQNNYIFNYFFDFNQVPLDWTPTRKFEAWILYNGYIILAGYVRLNYVTIEKEQKNYNITFYNGVGDVAANIGDKFMNQLDTSSINHPWSQDVVTYSQLDPNLFRLTGATNYSYQNGKTFWGLYNIGYEYSDSLSGAGLSQFYLGIEGAGPITISAGIKAFKAIYSDINSVTLNVGDYIRLTATGTTNYIEGTVTRVDREAVYFRGEIGLGTGTFSYWKVERILLGEINKANTPLISFSPLLTTGNTDDNSAAKPGYFDFSGTPVQDYYFKPSIQVKTLYEMIFNQAGYLIESNFFNTDYFQKYYLPLKFQEGILPKSSVEPCYTFSASSLTLAAAPTAQYVNPSVGSNCSDVLLSANTTTIFFPSGYTGEILWKFTWTQTNNSTCGVPPYPYFYYLFFDAVNPLGTVIYNDNAVCSSTYRELIVRIAVPSTEKIQFGFAGDAVTITSFTAQILEAPGILTPQNINYADEFPTDEFKQIDFITAINKLFNFIVVPSPNKQNTLIVEPIIDYIGKGEILDWTEKIDFNSPITVSPTTNILNGTLKYNFLLDQDYYNQQFNISRNRIFGTYEVQLNQDYKEQKTEFNTILGSPTDYPIPNTESPILTAPSMYAVKTKQERSESIQRLEPYKVIPRIIFRGNVEPNDNYRPGVYWYTESNTYGSIQQLSQLDRWQNMNRFNTYPFSYTGFSHFINFNAQDTYESDQYMPELQQDMYDVYYYDYISDIVSPENKLISAKIYLTPWEIANLRFDEKIIVKNNYYRINKISNYNLSEPSLCDIELIKLTKSYTPHPVIYYRLVSCNPLMEVLYTNSDLNYNLYAYIGRYVNVYTEAGSYVDCFEVQLDYPRYDVDYYHWFIGSGYTSSGVEVFSDCSCTQRAPFIIVQESYPIPTAAPDVTPTPTPSVTPTSVTPTPTPSNSPVPLTPTPTPTITSTQTNTPTITPTETTTPTITPTMTVTPTTSPVTPSLDPDAQAFLNAVVANGGTTDATISAATNTLFVDLKSYNLYTKIVSFYPYVGGVANSHQLEGKLQGSRYITFNGGWTHNMSGATPNGSTGWAEVVGFVASTDLTLYDTSLFTYLGTTASSGLGYVLDIGWRYDGAYQFQCYIGGNECSDSNSYFYMYGGGAQRTDLNTSQLPSGIGAVSFNRTSNSNANVWRNGVKQATNTSTISASLPTGNLKLPDTTDGFHTFSPRRHQFDVVASGLSDTEMTDLFTIINAFQTSLGRNVY